jgi:hypothetical protein
MIGLCERHADCTMPASSDTALCGFDPIPYADPAIRKLWVKYRCVSGGDDVWSELLLDPKMPAGDYRDPLILQSPTAKVICKTTPVP